MKGTGGSWGPSWTRGLRDEILGRCRPLDKAAGSLLRCIDRPFLAQEAALRPAEAEGAMAPVGSAEHGKAAPRGQGPVQDPAVAKEPDKVPSFSSLTSESAA